MTNGDGVFTFDLKESLWFKKGQEVKEIMGVSLEPEISIQEFEDFVSIRGVIELKGEYFQVDSDNDVEEEVLSLRNHPSQRFVDRVESYEGGVNEFYHQFPVEVSIPKYRVNSLDDVMVGIETFDYELPEKSQLQLQATIAIHGVSDIRETETETGEVEQRSEQPAEPEMETELEPELIEEPPMPPEEEKILEEEKLPVEEKSLVEETFEFDVKEKVEDEKGNINKAIVEEVSEKKGGKKEQAKEKASEKDRWKNKKSQTLAEFFGSHEKAKEEPAVEVEEEIIEESSEFESSIINFAANTKEEEDDLFESSREASGEKETSYLLNIFANQEEEERYSSLKMCIVQESDTLEAIAEKYKLSTYQLSQTNKLTDDELSEGQILYIPIKD
ncbi:stage VI sporulation protein D [Aquibacillus salsiterrae]|uniref:stage VI sporulation protein D n=1 Tax=Aquibacillus salsiterrae TaxID=2950439 RepID=UPI0023422310|nr:stage VI sporulation protein D [Aquibacillus salsiterrae]